MSDDDDQRASMPLGGRFLDFLFRLEIPKPRFGLFQLYGVSTLHLAIYT